MLVGTLNMDEFAYGFTTENTHYGATRNPHDRRASPAARRADRGRRLPARLVPLTLGSDTNGSIRVPSSLCGIFGLKPTFGRLSRRGSFPFVESLDHLGPFAATLPRPRRLLRRAAGRRTRTIPRARSAGRARAHAAWAGCIAGLRIARLAGYFDDNVTAPRARRGRPRVPGARREHAASSLPAAALGRAAAFVITASRRRRAASSAPAPAPRRASSRSRATASSRARWCPRRGTSRRNACRAWYRETRARAVRGTSTC